MGKSFEHFQYNLTAESKIFAIAPDDYHNSVILPEVILEWFELCDAIWRYDYDSPKPGYHALLKSGLHSDGFLLAPEVLKYHNLRRIIARQFFLRWAEIGISEDEKKQWASIGFSRDWEKVNPKPDYVAGIPKAAKELGRNTAESLYANFVRLEKKEDGLMELIDKIPAGKTCLIVEDICTKGTGFREAVSAIKKKSPNAILMPYEFVIVNRGGLKEIEIEDIGYFQIVALVEHRINEWSADECPLCKRGSISIKPKAIPENWELIKNGQK
ncbi:MAG: hypothetical protein A3I88_01970 [Candidatus Portnoybacteria bacterium RIFCSPLOWO2_12_FULL_39_9]|uniref:Phosphoribosyltransferase domain-containing protein n=1 Tax=Candidatus Portnoybacteria bacterium RIFCSPHIGHO2_12_FULL_38_9 TaxID=1801997 RepID=A0A1G2FF52_9BACT|nr:MAG: hypothetical protein A3H00_00515 [Candidatus Portnoybacteria bacterium RBG_13_40_8]OGZ36171.1 MAG: hypothetical protein A3J64_00190 [Candidatus Portnoybacteria bacterium RIFCSPHIGHO2_12_FULL_38_9]OGZ37197.1 MAG: hypothetical protein A2646_03360 [Candidatus Portnoybacteria bacterium RIFCSPHIGHO2_02_FULL_39_12]OGZ38577.1 MAG: hypothetical protein A3F21_01110 [Candidatus Portnoybacteria bacterium RIFCSPLOWO2_01_FULL_38_39]OGZ41217.1 MAG: hypothetical protein A3I88_01970 [Candidatus Portnoy